jgi:hypothetical protein
LSIALEISVTFTNSIRTQFYKKTISTETEKQKCPHGAETGAERDAKLDAARPNGDRIGSACDIDHGITRRSGRNSANCRSGH